MKKILKYIFFIVLIVLASAACIILIQVTTTDNSGFTDLTNSPSSTQSFDFADLEISKIHEDSILDKFPYNQYLDRLEYQNIDSLVSHLRVLEGITENTAISQQAMFNALTYHLEKRIRTRDLDSLHNVLLLADKYHAFSTTRSPNDIFFQAISDHWYNYVSNQLASIAQSVPQSKYSFKFRYLAQRCTEQKYFVNTGNTKFEKVILYSIEGRWAYMLNRFIYSAAWSTRIVITLALLVFTFIITSCIFKSFRK